MRTSIVDRTKVLESLDMLLWKDVRLFYDQDLSTFLPPAFVRLNSKTRKTLRLFGEVMLSHSECYDGESPRNLKYIDSTKTSRQLFGSRSLI